MLGVYLHGLFEVPTVLQAMFGMAASTLDSVFAELTGYLGKHFEAGVLQSLIA